MEAEQDTVHVRIHFHVSHAISPSTSPCYSSAMHLSRVLFHKLLLKVSPVQRSATTTLGIQTRSIRINFINCCAHTKRGIACCDN